jgi:hypothetical protein
VLASAIEPVPLSGREATANIPFGRIARPTLNRKFADNNLVIVAQACLDAQRRLNEPADAGARAREYPRVPVASRRCRDLVAGAEPDGVRVAVLLWRLLRIDGYIQQIILSVVIIAAILLDRLRRQSV